MPNQTQSQRQITKIKDEHADIQQINALQCKAVKKLACVTLTGLG